MVQVFLGFLRCKLSSIFGFTKTPFADGLGVAHLLATIHILEYPWQEELLQGQVPVVGTSTDRS